MSWDITAWTSYMRAAGRPATTIRTRRQHINQLHAAHPASPWSLTTEDLVTWCGGHQWKPETRHAVRSSLRQFYAWGVQTGRTATNPALGLPPVRRTPPSPHPAPERVLTAALAAAGPREQLMIRLAAQCGLRRGEVAQVHTDDVVEDLTGWSLLVHGKGGRDRTVPLPDTLAFTLLGRPAGWVFPGTDGGHLTPWWVGRLVGRLLPEGWTMHTLRHRFATRAYSVDTDILTVQTLLGHASPATTQRYVAVPSASLRRTVNLVGA